MFSPGQCELSAERRRNRNDHVSVVERQEFMYETAVTLVGEVLSTPKSRETRNGNRVASFRMVSTARRFDRTRQCWVDGDRVYATVNCWKQLAESVLYSLDRNDSVVVTGRLRTREYEFEGQRRVTAEVEAGAVGLDVLCSVRTDSDGNTAEGGTEEALPSQLRPLGIVESNTAADTRHAIGA